MMNTNQKYLSQTREYSAWKHMIARCYNDRHKYYYRYGGRGIKVCDEWRIFDNFLKDMGYAEENLSLDRIDNDGDYTPENCRWASKREQSINRSNTHWIEFNGIKMHLAGWADKLNISREALWYRLKRFSIETALTTPKGRRHFGSAK